MSPNAPTWTRVGPAVDRALHDIFAEGSKPYRLGILFVHGMGEQERGDTITEMGDALTEWLRKWLGNDRFRIPDATLRGRDATSAGTASASTSGRAHASVILSHDREGEGEAWLLAESWWADAFRPASFSELVGWAIGVGPWLIASQWAGLTHRFTTADARVHVVEHKGEKQLHEGRPRHRRVVDDVIAFFLLLVAAVVAALITPLALALLVLSLIPIPAVSGLIQGLVRNLAASFGDLLVLVRSPLRFAAMAERVRDDIDALSRECDHIMVVAHSQGSAVAWHAIRRTAQKRPDERANIDLFFTFGQAFRKLKALYNIHTRRRTRDRVGFAVLALTSTAFLLATAWFGLGVLSSLVVNRGSVEAVISEASTSVFGLAISLAIVLVIQWRLAHMADSNDRESQGLILDDLEEVQRELPGFKWVDLWASADPAPNGPLFDQTVPGVESYRIRNLASTALDHSVYWSNVTEFVSAVAFRGGSLTRSSPLGTDPTPDDLRSAADLRELRVSMLATARVMVFAALGAAIVGLRRDLPAIGDDILASVARLPLLPDWFTNWHPTAEGFAAGLAITAIAAVVWWGLLWLWNSLIQADELRFFAEGHEQPAWTPGAMGWMLAGIGVPTAVALGLSLVRGDTTFIVTYASVALLGLGAAVVLLRGHESRLGHPDPQAAEVEAVRAAEAAGHP